MNILRIYTHLGFSTFKCNADYSRIRICSNLKHSVHKLPRHGIAINKLAPTLVSHMRKRAFFKSFILKSAVADLYIRSCRLQLQD